MTDQISTIEKTVEILTAGRRFRIEAHRDAATGVLSTHVWEDTSHRISSWEYRTLNDGPYSADLDAQQVIELQIAALKKHPPGRDNPLS